MCVCVGVWVGVCVCVCVCVCEGSIEFDFGRVVGFGGYLWNWPGYGWISPLRGQEDLDLEMSPHSSILARRIP